MKQFFRSLRYLRPYRGRLAASIVCAVVIAVLWGGGLGMIAPVLKVMLDPEGLHGWAWRSLTQDRLRAKVVLQPIPARMRGEDLPISVVLQVVEVEADESAERGGVRGNDWILGIADGRQDHLAMNGDDLARLLAGLPAGHTVRLRVYDQHTDGVDEEAVTLAADRFGHGLLGRFARAIPEPKDYRERFPLFVWLLLLFLGLNILRNLLRFIQDYIVRATVWRGMMDLRCDAFNAALRLPVTFYAVRGTSDTTSRFIQDTGVLAGGQIMLFGRTVVEPAKAAAALVMAILFSWELTVLLLIAGPPTFLLIRLFGKIMKRASRRALESFATMLRVLTETLAGVRVVKAYTMEAGQRRRFFQINRKLFKEQRRMSRTDAAASPTIELMGVTAGLFAAGVGGYLVLYNRLDPIVFVAWMGCLAGVFDPVRRAAKIFTQFQRAEAAATRVFELQDEEQEKRISAAPSLPPHSQSVQFRDVSFRYPNTDEDSLTDINLAIEAGRTIAVVGPNGSGKTTLVSLVPRLLDPTAGSVLIDGQDVSQFSIRSLRRQIGLVTQDAVLFNTTIAQNIACGLRRPRSADVLDAAEKAYVDEFVRELSDGYETMVGEHGATLSGGQKQRISIARAILRDPRILIFDEAMSQVDSESERRIHQAMEQFIKDRTTLLVAHRFATVLTADTIVVMNEGRIIDAGVHDELLQRCQLYKHLYKTQFGDAEA